MVTDLEFYALTRLAEVHGWPESKIARMHRLRQAPENPEAQAALEQIIAEAKKLAIPMGPFLY